MERFLNKIAKRESDCWVWTAALRGRSGYGAFKLNGKVVDAHRLSFRLYKGQIPEGLLVCHMCDNRKCANPDHLFLGTKKDNYEDAKAKGRLKNIKPLPHPSDSSYHKGCRCKGCREAHNRALRKYRYGLKERGSGQPGKTGK